MFFEDEYPELFPDLDGDGDRDIVDFMIMDDILQEEERDGEAQTGFWDSNEDY